MNKAWLVFKNEFITVVRRRSFLLTLILLPLISFLILVIVAQVQKSTGTSTSQMINDLLMPSAKPTLEGFVDQSGLVKAIPEGYVYRLKQFDSEAAAQQAINNKEITAYYLIDKDYLSSGKVVYIRPDFNPLGGSLQSSSIEALMAYNLTGKDMQLYYRVQNPLNLTTQVTDSEAPKRDSDNAMTFFLPYIVTFLFYITIMTSASLLLSSITTEKQNRVMEVLMTSVTPRQMLAGKIVALGLIGLLQTVVWSASGLLLLRFSGQNFALGAAFQLPASILLWGVLFFLLGYAVYASLMAGVGALVPSLREASQLTTVIILPMIIPLMFISTLIQSPDSSLAVFFSIFPLTSPVAMMTRLAATDVPVWQCLLALGLLLVCAVYFIRAAANLFKTQNLLSGKSINTPAFLKALFGKTV